MRQITREAVLLAALALGSAATPRALHGQQQPSPSSVGDEQLSAYANAYVEIARGRDEVQAQLANARNKTPEAQKALREGLQQKKVAILKEKGVTEEEYQRITYIISVDPERRQAFDRILADLTKTEGESGLER